MGDEPRFLKDPPRDEEAKPLNEEVRTFIEPIVTGIIEARAALASVPPVQPPRSVPPATATDDAIDLGGYWLRFKVPTTWRERARGDRHREWLAREVHPVKLDLVASHSSPEIEELLLERASTRPPDGYHHVQVRPIRHPSHADAAEITEVLATAPPPRPLRVLQLLRHIRLAVSVQLDAPQGTFAPGVAGEYAAFFEALGFTFR